MDNLRDIAAFRSERFRPALPEERQVNPGVYGEPHLFKTRLQRRHLDQIFPAHVDAAQQSQITFHRRLLGVHRL